VHHDVYDMGVTCIMTIEGVMCIIRMYSNDVMSRCSSFKDPTDTMSILMIF
jgi:hypothetical protein